MPPTGKLADLPMREHPLIGVMHVIDHAEMRTCPLTRLAWVSAKVGPRLSAVQQEAPRPRTRSGSEATVTRDARGPYAWLAVGIGLVAAVIWASLAVRAVVMSNEPSTRALVVCATLVAVGLALGPAYDMLTAPLRARRPPSEAAMLAKMKVPNAMLGIAVIGMGASPIVDASPNAWDWALMALTSLAGGISLSASFLTIDGHAASPGQPNHATWAPQSDG